MQRLAATLFAPAMLAAALVGTPASSDEPLVDAIRFGLEGDRTRIVIDSDRPLDPPLIFTLAEGGARVVVDLERVDFELGGGQWTEVGVGVVSGYRYAANSSEMSRVVFDLAEPAAIRRSFQLEPAHSANRYRTVVDLTPTSPESFLTHAGDPRGAAAPASAGTPEQSNGSGQPGRTRIVVIDAGHGGSDVGTTGADGAHEKTVNLALARDVRERLEEIGGYEIVMTRDGDRFVEVEDRVHMARRVGADLMVSIHADADPQNPSTHGASVYTLDYNFEHRSSEILEDDQRILDVDLTSRSEDVSEILVDLVQSDTRAQSNAFAELLIPHLDRAGPLVGNTHRRGNLMVLLAPDVPAVLVEAGFMTNPRDEARLTSRADRGELADAIVAGVEEYFEQRERLYAAR